MTEDEDDFSAGVNGVDMSTSGSDSPDGEMTYTSRYRNIYTGKPIHKAFNLSISSSNTAYDIQTSSSDTQRFDCFEEFKTYWDDQASRTSDNKLPAFTYCPMDHSGYRNTTMSMDSHGSNSSNNNNDKNDLKVTVESAFMAKELHGSALMYASFLAVWFNHIGVPLEEIYATVLAISCVPWKQVNCQHTVDGDGNQVQENSRSPDSNSEIQEITEEETTNDLQQQGVQPVQLAESSLEYITTPHRGLTTHVLKPLERCISYKVSKNIRKLT